VADEPQFISVTCPACGALFRLRDPIIPTHRHPTNHAVRGRPVYVTDGDVCTGSGTNVKESAHG